MTLLLLILVVKSDDFINLIKLFEKMLQMNSSLPRKVTHQPNPLAFQQKINHIALLNLKDQDLDICACQGCIYGRQLHRKPLIKLDMSKGSSYRRSFQPMSQPHNNTTIVTNPEHMKQRDCTKKAVDGASSYLSDFNIVQTTKPERYKPSDQLKFKGPTSAFSSYLRQYHEFKNNRSPYVKPTEVYIPNNSKTVTSTYQSQFHTLDSGPSQTGKRPDMLKGGQPWTGGSTYRQLFSPLPKKKQSSEKSTPLQQVSALDEQLVNESLANESNYKHQYQTIYRNDYLEGRKKCGRGNGELNKLLQSLQI